MSRNERPRSSESHPSLIGDRQPRRGRKSGRERESRIDIWRVGLAVGRAAGNQLVLCQRRPAVRVDRPVVGAVMDKTTASGWISWLRMAVVGDVEPDRHPIELV